MDADIERNLGEQPLTRLMAEHGLKHHDLVAATNPPITHKMVTRACKGRRLTPHAQLRILGALNRAANKTYTLKDLFTY